MPVSEPPMSFFTAKQAFAVFLLGSGAYALHFSRLERPSGMRTMMICGAMVTISVGAYDLAMPYLRKKLAKLEEYKD